jgi:lantibiotic modifying enzyme
MEANWWVRGLALAERAVLGEAPADLAGRVVKPGWVDIVERASGRVLPATSGGWREACVAPLVNDASNRLRENARRRVRWLDAAVPAIVAVFADQLTVSLAALLARVAKPAGLPEFMAQYPVVARLLGQACEFAVEAHLELLSRFAADRRTVVAELLGGVNPGPLVAVHTGHGDTHQRGRSVATLGFADGRRVVYKPRDIGGQRTLGTLVRWLNGVVPGLELRAASTVVGDGYGWTEFVDAEPIGNPGGAERFYGRQGALLALLHVVRASDVHCENLIACGDQPVLVDAETLFHPTTTGHDNLGDPAAAALAASVYRTGLLPFVVLGKRGVLDMSGLGGRTRNRPRIGERELDPGDHEMALLEGFRQAYDAITAHRNEFRTLLRGCADVMVRVVVRPTRGYRRLLDESIHPAVLCDALDRDRLFSLLWTDVAGDPLRWHTAQHESADLWAGDVPLFLGRATTTSLSASTGEPLAVQLDRPGMLDALDTLDAMGEADRRNQEWIVSAALATRLPGSHHSVPPMPCPVKVGAADPAQLLTAVCDLADRLVATGMSRGDRVNWLGLEPADERRWLMAPMGAGLANGYLGVALFLAQLAKISGISRYGDVARSAIVGVPAVLDAVTGRDDVIASIGCGGLNGFGGIAYGLARLSTLLNSPDIRRWARQAVDLCAVAAKAPGPPGFANGHAGCLVAMTAVHAELGLAAAQRLAIECADWLRKPGWYGVGSTPAGFADGTAGIRWALAQFRGPATTVAAARISLASHGPGWCTGSAGSVLAELCATDPAPTELDRAIDLLATRPPLMDLSLCHGELGIAEVLTVAGRSTALRERACLILDTIGVNGPVCGTPGAVPASGLLTGLAGIGYGLLRLGFAERVPSVLLLQTHAGSAIPVDRGNHR